MEKLPAIWKIKTSETAFKTPDTLTTIRLLQILLSLYLLFSVFKEIGIT